MSGQAGSEASDPLIVDWADDSSTWTPEMHRAMACSTLDGLHVNSLGQSGYGSLPPTRHYTSIDDGESDLGPFLAALTHAVLAALAAVPPEGEEDGGCDCTELCEMGPTCPGGMLARLPGSGCWRGEEAGDE